MDLPHPTTAPEPRRPWAKTILRPFLYSLALIVLTAWLTHSYDKKSEFFRRGAAPHVESGPWGDLLVSDIRVEQPKEYAAFAALENTETIWDFGKLAASDIRNVLQESGLTAEETATALSTNCLRSENNETVIHPPESLLLSIAPDTRSKLYSRLAAFPANRNHITPYFVPEGDVDRLLKGDKEASPEIQQLIKKLLYKRNGFTFFSDPEVVLSHIHSPESRLDFYRSLTGQNAVLARILIRPNTDIDKLIGYWALSVPGVRSKDLMPLLEAEQRLPGGGSLSLLYFLPPLVRDRLYTSPLPPSGEQKPPDCHWTALNFFNHKPDDRLLDLTIASQVVEENFYQIAMPGIYGDLVLILNPRGQVVHSAVYLANNIVFTKNGINYAVPWILMRVNDLIGTYSSGEPCRAVYFRRKEL